jgi:hypothetical protein
MLWSMLANVSLFVGLSVDRAAPTCRARPGRAVRRCLHPSRGRRRSRLWRGPQRCPTCRRCSPGSSDPKGPAPRCGPTPIEPAPT